MERQRRRAGVDELRADLEARARAVAQPAAHLHAHRHVDRVRHRLDDRRGASGLVEQRRAGAGLRHLADGAAEVDVDEVGAGRLDHPRRLGHRPRLGAEDLDRERVLVGGDAEVAERLLVPVLDPGAADHLRADEPGAEAASLAAKRLHADARHRRQDEPRRDLHVADVPAFAQVDLHGLLMVLTGIDPIRSCRYHSGPRRRVTAGFCLREAALKEVILTPEGYEKLKQEIEVPLDREAPRGRGPDPRRARVRRHRRERRVRRRQERAGDARAQIAQLEERLSNARVIQKQRRRPERRLDRRQGQAPRRRRQARRTSTSSSARPRRIPPSSSSRTSRRSARRSSARRRARPSRSRHRAAR